MSIMAIGIISAVIISVALVGLYRRAIYRFLRARWLLAKIPGIGITPLPILGHATSLLKGSPIEFFERVDATMLDITSKSNQKLALIWSGPMPTLFVFHPDTAEVILRSSKHIEKSFVYDYLHPWLGTGLLTSKGRKWQQRRKLITPTFHFKILEEFLGVMNDQSQTLLNNLEKMRKQNIKIDLPKCITLNTLDIICETAMGKSVNAQVDQNSEYVKALNSVAEIIVHRMYTPWIWSDFIFKRTAEGRQQKKDLKVLHSFTQSVISERMKNNDTKIKKRMAFLDVLLAARTEDGEKLPFSGIQEEVDTFMFEGHDTTAAAMVWSLYLLGRHPDIQRRVQEEIDDVTNGDRTRPFTTNDLTKLEYLEQVIKESLRVLPSVPGFARITSEECVVDGYTIPKGTNVQVMAYTIHRNCNVWDEIETFDPDRFSKTNSVGRHPYAFIPFSAGPRNCIGQKFALMEEKVIIGQLLRHYDVHSTTKYENIERIGTLVLRSGENLNLTITERKK